MNYASISGRLTRDVEVREGKNSTFANITLAVDNFYKDSADFINCTVWGNQAENLAKYMHKGDKILVSGELNQNVYEDKNGTKHYETYINVQRVEFMTIRKAEEEEEEEKPKQKGKYNRNSRR